ncbi:hypothetical protein GCM10009738_44090 [Kitasatospora viridis]|uniref:hypothetical protein n=1 Tax=Kitasatospora viridis TaxID=281105 RepID=UPI0031DEEB73
MTDDRFGHSEGAHAPPSDDPSAAERVPGPDHPSAAVDPSAPAPSAAADAAASEEPQEQVVRALLHRSVEGIQPAPDALARIRRAVPARRARYRQAWTGAALIVVLSAVAVPTLNGLGALQLSDGSAAGSSPTSAGSGSATAGSAARSGRPVVPLPVPETASAVPAPTSAPASPSASAGAPSTSPTAATGPSSAAPACQRGDLGTGAVTVGLPDAAGRVYGNFSVNNVSGHPCLLGDPGTLSGQLSGGTGTVRVLDHTAGDPAGGLPAATPFPAGGLLLAAGAGYQLPFAWVPDAACPSGGQQSGGQSPTTAPAPTGGAASAAAGPAGSGAAAQQGGPAVAAASPATAADGGASPAATGSPAPPPPTAPTQAPSTAATPGTLSVALRPLGVAPDAASTLVTGVCGGGTLYRGSAQ